MQITIYAASTQEEDGEDAIVTVTKNVSDVWELLDIFSHASRAIGYTYVDRVGYATELGEQTWSKF